MHARAVAEHLAKRCMKNLGAVRGASPAEDRLHEDGVGTYLAVSNVSQVPLNEAVGQRGLGDVPVYRFIITQYNSFSRGRSGYQRLWIAKVIVTKEKDVIVIGDAPKHVSNCLESSYNDLRG